ncbi:amidohydrolase family protein [Thermoleptolyngbya sp.]
MGKEPTQARSNDTGNLLQEACLAFLLARVRGNLAADLTARAMLEGVTLGGARVLGQDDIGAIAPGMAADFIAIHLDRPQFAGALHDPVSALVFCQCDRVDYSFINSKKVVDQGQLVPVELETLAEKSNQIAQNLVSAL